MTIDISSLLFFLVNQHWSHEDSSATAQGLALASRLQLDHDEGAGESWIRLLRGNTNVAFVHREHPLVFVDPSIQVGPRPAGIITLISVDLSARVLTAQPQSLEAAFPGSSSSPAFGPTFSADDLWYATV